MMNQWMPRIVLLLLGAVPVFSQQVFLALKEVSPPIVRLAVESPAAGEVELQGSYNLAQWFQIGSQSTPGGPVEFRHTNSGPAGSIFYRALATLGPEAPKLVPQLDTNYTAGTLITPEEGGRMSLTLPDGMLYEFRAGSNLVTEPVAVGLTLITNIGEFPENEGYRAAVAFSPEGLQLLGEAELRIQFPGDLPAADMLAYSFSDDGSGFHLIQSRPEARAITLRLTHFSGGGVARFSKEPAARFNRSWDRSRAAVAAAEHRAALRNWAAARDQENGAITAQEEIQRRAANELQMLDEIYREAVQPFEELAGSDCAVGQAVVVGELERLSRLWSGQTGGTSANNPYDQILQRVVPRVRCACAHALLDRCEKEPTVSGSALLSALDSLLDDARLVSHSSDAQGCDLGSDDQIRQRLTDGPCFANWQGTIVLTRIQSRQGSDQLGNVNYAWDNETRQVYVGRVTTLAEETSFVVDNKPTTVWILNTKGGIQFGHRELETQIYPVGADVIATSKDTESTSDSAPGKGIIHLTLTAGAFDGLGIEGESASSDYRHPYTFTHRTTYECTSPRPPANPCPKPEEFTLDQSVSYFQGYSVNPNDKGLSVSVTPNTVDLTWLRVKEIANGFGPPDRTEERITLHLARNSR